MRIVKNIQTNKDVTTGKKYLKVLLNNELILLKRMINILRQREKRLFMSQLLILIEFYTALLTSSLERKYNGTFLDCVYDFILRRSRFNPFEAFLYPLKTSENSKLSYEIWGHRKGALT